MKKVLSLLAAFSVSACFWTSEELARYHLEGKPHQTLLYVTGTGLSWYRSSNKKNCEALRMEKMYFNPGSLIIRDCVLAPEDGQPVPLLPRPPARPIPNEQRQIFWLEKSSAPIYSFRG